MRRNSTIESSGSISNSVTGVRSISLAVAAVTASVLSTART
jgi:hypothetical protein